MKIIFQSFNIKYSDFQKFITFRRNKNPVSAKAGTTKKTLYCTKSAQKKRPRKQTASEVCLSGLILLSLIAICMLPTR